VAVWAGEELPLARWDADTRGWKGGAMEARFGLPAGSRPLLRTSAAYAERFVIPSRAATLSRLESTIRFWTGWSAARQYSGPWADAVIRSTLALKLMIFAPSGASVAAPTTSLPEEIGGERNWDYRFCWIRDSNFMIDALLQLGCV